MLTLNWSSYKESLYWITIALYYAIYKLEEVITLEIILARTAVRSFKITNVLNGLNMFWLVIYNELYETVF